MKKTFTSCLGDSIDRYLKLKEALGRRFAIERRVLEQLDDFMIEAAAEDLSQVEFDDWCRTQLHISSGVRRNRMRIVRNFCLYRQRTAQTSLSRTPICFPHDTKRSGRMSSPIGTSCSCCGPVRRCRRRLGLRYARRCTAWRLFCCTRQG